MILVGLTGCIGSGKSTVSTLLALRGAQIIDGDKIARELQQPGRPILTALVNEFGEVLLPDGSLDRARLAGIVFGDEERLAALNAIMRPAIAEAVQSRIDSFVLSDEVVVLDMPLLVENPRKDLAGVVVVDVDPETAVRRLVEGRGMAERDARSRLAAQATREQRLAVADFVIDNEGDQTALDEQVARAWDWMKGLPSWKKP